MGSIERFLALAGAAFCSVSGAAYAAPSMPHDGSPRAMCLEQHEQAQAARLSGKLAAARSALRQCSAASCPALVSRDCLGWLAEVEQQIPSVIFRATKDGADLTALRILDGEQLLTDALTGTPLELDPGPHHFTAELPGFPAQQATYVLHAGDKGRVVRFEFVSAASAPPAEPAPPPPEAPALRDEPVARERPIPTLSYALGGAALAAAAAAGVLGGLAMAKREDVERRCAPLCAEREVRGVRQLALAADVSLVVALLSAGGATYAYVTRPAAPLAARPRVSALKLGAQGIGAWSVTAGGRF